MARHAQNPELLDAVISGELLPSLLVIMQPDEMAPRAKQERQAVRKNSVINAMSPDTFAQNQAGETNSAVATVSEGAAGGLIDDSSDDDDHPATRDVTQARVQPHKPAGAAAKKGPRRPEASDTLLGFIDPSHDGALRPNQATRFTSYVAAAENEPSVLKQYLSVLCLKQTTKQAKSTDTLAL